VNVANPKYWDRELQSIPIDSLIHLIGGKPKGPHHRSEYKLPAGTVSVSPQPDGGDSFHFWGGPLHGTSGHGAISFAAKTGIAGSDKYPVVCEFLRAYSGAAASRTTHQPMVARAQPAKNQYIPPHRIFDLQKRTTVLIDYLSGQRKLPAALIKDLARQEHSPLAVGYGEGEKTIYGHYLIFPLRNHADPRKPEVGAILRWREPGDPPKHLFGGKPGPKVKGTDSSKGWWQVGAYPAPTLIITEAPIDALSLWAGLSEKNRESTRIIATGGEGGLKAPGLWAGTERIFLAQDRDNAGHQQALKTWIAAYAASVRCPVTRILPPGTAKDWNAAWQVDPRAVQEALSQALAPAQARAQSQARSR